MSDVAHHTLSEVEALHRFVVPWVELDWPIDWDRCFGTSGSLGVEIGFGNGDFLVDLAEKQPDARFVGVERGWGSIQRALKRLRRKGLDNVRVLQVDAAFAIDRLFRTESLDQVYINFPDPWPKERHHPRRLIQPAFIEMLAHRMISGGHLLAATDHPDLALWIAEVIRGQERFKSPTPTPWVHEMPGRSPTKYERKAIAAGTPIHYFQLKRGAFSALDTPVDRIEDVPNVILTGDFERDGLLTDVGQPEWHYRESDTLVKVRGIYRDLSAGHRLVEVMVKEGAFSQTFGISVLHRPEGGLLVKLSALGHPRPTWGVKQAVLNVARTVMEGCPGMKMVSSTIPE